jgi:hypothetical protein
MAPALLRLGDAATFYFTPYATPLLNTHGPAYVPVFPGRIKSSDASIRAVPGDRPGTLHWSDPLRFDHSFKAPVPDSRWQFEAGPRRN